MPPLSIPNTPTPSIPTPALPSSPVNHNLSTLPPTAHGSPLESSNPTPPPIVSASRSNSLNSQPFTSSTSSTTSASSNITSTAPSSKSASDNVSPHAPPSTSLPRGRAPKDPNAKTFTFQCATLADLQVALRSYLRNPPASPQNSTCELTINDSMATFPVLLAQNANFQPAPAVDVFHTNLPMLDALNASQNPIAAMNKQRAIAKACVEAVQRVDGYRYSFHNKWRSGEDNAHRFSYYCNDSYLNKDRVANGKAGSQGKRATKPVYDCKGVLAVKFSAARQCVDVVYRHIPLHQTYEQRAPIPRRDSRRRVEWEQTCVPTNPTPPTTTGTYTTSENELTSPEQDNKEEIENCESVNSSKITGSHNSLVKKRKRTATTTNTTATPLQLDTFSPKSPVTFNTVAAATHTAVSVTPSATTNPNSLDNFHSLFESVRCDSAEPLTSDHVRQLQQLVQDSQSQALVIKLIILIHEKLRQTQCELHRTRSELQSAHSDIAQLNTKASDSEQRVKQLEADASSVSLAQAAAAAVCERTRTPQQPHQSAAASPYPSNPMLPASHLSATAHASAAVAAVESPFQHRQPPTHHHPPYPGNAAAAVAAAAVQAASVGHSAPAGPDSSTSLTGGVAPSATSSHNTAALSHLPHPHLHAAHSHHSQHSQHATHLTHTHPHSHTHTHSQHYHSIPQPPPTGQTTGHSPYAAAAPSPYSQVAQPPPLRSDIYDPQLRWNTASYYHQASGTGPTGDPSLWGNSRMNPSLMR